MRQSYLLLTALLLSVTCMLPAADSQEPLPIGWTIDWVDDSANDEAFNINTKGRTTLRFVIENNELAPMSFELVYEWADDNHSFSLDGPETAEVGAGSAEEYEVSIFGVKVLEHVGGSEFEFDITATRIYLESVPSSDSNELEGTVINPSIHDISLTLDAEQPNMQSGTSIQLEATITNSGNVNSFISQPKMNSGACPQLIFDEVDNLDGMMLPWSGSTTESHIVLHEIEISAPSSHPSKTCHIELQITDTSTGETSHASTNVEVKHSGSSSSASSSSGGSTGSGCDDNVEDCDKGTGNTDPDETTKVTGNFLFSLHLVTGIFSITLAAVVKKRNSAYSC